MDLPYFLSKKKLLCSTWTLNWMMMNHFIIFVLFQLTFLRSAADFNLVGKACKQKKHVTFNQVTCWELTQVDLPTTTADNNHVTKSTYYGVSLSHFKGMHNIGQCSLSDSLEEKVLFLISFFNKISNFRS